MSPPPNGGTTNATIINGNAIGAAQSRTINTATLTFGATATNGSIANVTIVNRDTHASPQSCPTNTSTALTIDATIVNHGTANATIVNEDVTIASQSQTINTTTLSIGTTVVSIDSLTVAQLKGQLRVQGLRVGGNKAALKLICTTVINVADVAVV